MYIKIGNKFADGDLEFTRDFLEHLDVKLIQITNKISLSSDPDSEGLLDHGEYYIGVGFSVTQNYITSTYPQLDVKKWDALKFGSKVSNSLTVMELLNAGANYWKHQEEWGFENIISKNLEELSKPAQRTIETIEIITPWADYTCSNILAALLGEKKLELTALIPFLEEWRNHLDQEFG